MYEAYKIRWVEERRCWRVNIPIITINGQKKYKYFNSYRIQVLKDKVAKLLGTYKSTYKERLRREKVSCKCPECKKVFESKIIINEHPKYDQLYFVFCDNCRFEIYGYLTGLKRHGKYVRKSKD